MNKNNKNKNKNKNKNAPKIIFKKTPKKFNNKKKKNFRDSYKQNRNNNFRNYQFNSFNSKLPKKKLPLFTFPKKNKYSNYQLPPPKKELIFEIDPNKEGSSNILELLFKNIMKKENDDGKNKPEKKEELEKKEIFKIDYQKDVDIIKQDSNSLEQIIKLGKLFEGEHFNKKNYTINIKAIYKMTPALLELNSLIGLKNIKKKLIDQIKFCCQNFHNEYDFNSEQEKKGFLAMRDKKPLKSISFKKNESCLNKDDDYDMMHTVIEGPPGVGKTIFGKILARIYLSLGISKKDTFKIVRRSDLIGEFLGHTARLTEKAIDEAIGGVLFIDEAYSLGNGNGKKMDSYSKECIDTINQALTERKGQFICIIAGYKKELEENFFSVNPGLRRRFTFTYSIEKYSWNELTEILIQKINKINWTINSETTKWLFETKFLENKMENFPHFGGDIETLMLHIKIEHSSRVFGKHYKLHKIISKEDIENAYKLFIDKRKKNKNIIPFGIYI